MTDGKAQENVLPVTDGKARGNLLLVTDGKRDKIQEVINLEQRKSSNVWLEPHSALETGHFSSVLCYSVAT